MVAKICENLDIQSIANLVIGYPPIKLRVERCEHKNMFIRNETDELRLALVAVSAFSEWKVQNLHINFVSNIHNDDFIIDLCEIVNPMKLWVTGCLRESQLGLFVNYLPGLRKLNINAGSNFNITKFTDRYLPRNRIEHIEIKSHEVSPEALTVFADRCTKLRTFTIFTTFKNICKKTEWNIDTDGWR